MLSAKEILVTTLEVPEELFDNKPDIFNSVLVKSGELLPSVIYEIRKGNKPMDRRGMRPEVYKLNIFSYFNNNLKTELGFSSESLNGIEKELEKRKKELLEYLKDPNKKKREKPKYRTYTTWK